MNEHDHKVRTPIFPPYARVRYLLKIFDGVPKAAVRGMLNDVFAQTGTPQNPVDWSEPNTWIAKRLAGVSAALARRIWEESGHEVNPRYTNGTYLFFNHFDLLQADGAGVYRLSDRGRAFLNEDPDTVYAIDEAEGIGELLGILATKTRAMRGDLLPEWSQFLLEHSKFKTASTFKDTLRRRLVNLIERKLVEREGNSYVITRNGLEYAALFDILESDPKREVIQTVGAYNQEQRGALRERLGDMPPPQFERLVGDLLEAMGYEDVTVTKQSGDKGVDVVATVQFGITTITEVVQVKRQKGSIRRPVLDQLRGALPYHKALRGTIITLGSFTKGCTEAALFPGAAPITLIDGNRLIDLLEEHEVGMRKNPIILFEIDESYFKPDEEDEEILASLKGNAS